MIKLFSLKQEKEKEAAAAGSGDTSKKVAPGLIRMQKGACMPHVPRRSQLHVPTPALVACTGRRERAEGE